MEQIAAKYFEPTENSYELTDINGVWKIILKSFHKITSNLNNDPKIIDVNQIKWDIQNHNTSSIARKYMKTYNVNQIR